MGIAMTDDKAAPPFMVVTHDIFSLHLYLALPLPPSLSPSPPIEFALVQNFAVQQQPPDSHFSNQAPASRRSQPHVGAARAQAMPEGWESGQRHERVEIPTLGLVLEISAIDGKTRIKGFMESGPAEKAEHLVEGDEVRSPLL
jgi:hypothetical protein